jgi:hypothetical protein
MVEPMQLISVTNHLLTCDKSVVYHHDINEILLKVTLNTINPSLNPSYIFEEMSHVYDLLLSLKHPHVIMIFMFYRQLSLGTADYLTNATDPHVGYD